MRSPILDNKSSRAVVLAAMETVISQLPTLVPDLALPYNGATLSVTEVVAVLQAQVTALLDIEALLAQHHSAILAADASATKVHAVVGNLVTFIALLYGEHSDQYTGLGFKPRKVAVKTPRSKATAAEKARATRVARGTKGKRQRAGIHGVVPDTEPSKP